MTEGPKHKKLDFQKQVYRAAGADLSNAEFRVLVVLGTYSNARSANAHPALSRLVAETGCSKSTVWAALKRLEELGYIEKIKQGGNQVRRGVANVYRLKDPHAATPQGFDERTEGSGERTEGFDERTPSGPLSGHQSGPNKFHGQRFATDHFGSPRGAATPAPILDAIQEAAGCGVAGADELYAAIAEHWGSELAAYQELNFSSVPAHAADRYQAGAWANKFLNTAAREGYEIED